MLLITLRPKSPRLRRHLPAPRSRSHQLKPPMPIRIHPKIHPQTGLPPKPPPRTRNPRIRRPQRQVSEGNWLPIHAVGHHTRNRERPRSYSRSHSRSQTQTQTRSRRHTPAPDQPHHQQHPHPPQTPHGCTSASSTGVKSTVAVSPATTVKLPTRPFSESSTAPLSRSSECRCSNATAR